ncbi:hypothetical protein ISN74_05345 [Dyella caseinilytica]|uniref:Uncharacterized protein n=2 Tax=Dyella caseinilytica TaxID=1849581 RepID=A0ABX7GWJ2_9GAMM|nr:hypothetical protein ISN74_05345 [Dyella caseinilytica]GFZ96803.1 hypothetical protein GCM10011408_16560 [Dyella caseinilytica]
MDLQSREAEHAVSQDGERSGQSVEVSLFHTPYLGVINVFFFSAWVAVCSVAPEFIWQGLLSIVRHFDSITAASALLVGSIVAFFVEPLTERLRAMRLHVTHRHRTPAHATLAAFGFAVLAVCMHEAITSFVATASADHRAEDSLFYALSEVFQWAWIPFVTTVAWLYAGRSRWISWPALLLAALSVLAIGFVWQWAIQDTFTTIIPCASILVAGYVAMHRSSIQPGLSRCTRLTAWIAMIWLAVAGLLQLGLSLFAHRSGYIYSWMEYAIDFRFYVGWVIGLMVAPRPVPHH